MLDAAHSLFARELGHVLQRGGLCITEVTAPPDKAFVHVALAVVRLRPNVVLRGFAVAQAVAQLVGGAEFVLDRGGEHIAFFFLKIAVVQAIPVFAAGTVFRAHRAAAGQIGRLGIAPAVGNAAIGHIVGLQVLPAQGDFGGCAHAKGDGGGNAPAFVFRAIAPGHIGIVGHGVQAQAHGVRQLAVQVQRGALVLVGAQADISGDEVFVLGFFGRQVDRPARPAAPGIGRVGSLDDLNGLQVEHLARAGGNVAHAIDKGAGLRIHAANKRLVARGVAALAVAKGDAGGGFQGLLQAGGPGLLQHLFGNHLHGFGGVHQRRGEFARSGLVGLERAVARHGHSREGVGGRGRLRQDIGADQGQTSGQGQLRQFAVQARFAVC